MYENPSFLQKKWLNNSKLQIHSDKIWADSSTQNTLKYLKTNSADLSDWPKYLRYLKKKISLGVRSLWTK